MLRRLLSSLDHVQQRRAPLAIAVAVLRKFADDQGGGLAAQVAYYAFFSLFPLLLALTTLLGFVLSGDVAAQRAVQGTVLRQLPIVGNQIAVRGQGGSAAAVIIGLALSLWAGLGVCGAAQAALDRVWAVPYKQRPGFVQSRLRGLGLLAALGALFSLSTAASGLVSGGFGGVGDLIAGWAVALVVNLCLFMATFRLMGPGSIPTRQLRAGAACGAVAWTALQSLGGFYVGHVLARESGTVGRTFALVIALLVWLHLGAQLLLLCAELNVVLARGLWPRSLLGPPDEPADRRTLAALAKVEERSEQERIKVSFDAPAMADPASPPPGSAGGADPAGG
ncbi:MAG TPA: YihY/virulence factor BrkB family protein [Solirubrobacteraceae bacterium]|nr:YihY/virulence factor BrkB family protein [Solirubrobacteraceae bacterium]